MEELVLLVYGQHQHFLSQTSDLQYLSFITRKKKSNNKNHQQFYEIFIVGFVCLFVYDLKQIMI